jgi:hypothetical protein
MLTSLVFLIEQIAPGLYLLLGAGLLLALRALFRARYGYRSTQFELERDMARFQRANALTTVILLVEAVLIVFGVQRIVAPYLRETEAITVAIAQIAEDGIFQTPTPQAAGGGFTVDTSGVQLGEQDPAELVVATPTLTPTPVGTIVPNSPAPVGCDTPNATLQVPANGQIMFEPTIIRGTAFGENFAFYKFELGGGSLGNFAPVTEYITPVETLGDLGQFVPSPYPPDEYRFRLVVFDASNAVIASCAVTVFLRDPIPTPTPLGTVAATATPAP